MEIAQRDLGSSSLPGSESIPVIGAKGPSFAPVRVKRGISGPLQSDDEDRGDEPEDWRT